MPVALTLKVFKGDLLVGTKEFSRDIIKIGRLSSAHLSLDDEKISRIHSVIQVSADDQISILDMGSAEGTFVNGKRISKVALKSGDEIKLGATRIVLEVGAPAAAEVAPPTTEERSDLAIAPEPPAPEQVETSPAVAEAAASPDAESLASAPLPASAVVKQLGGRTRRRRAPLPKMTLSHQGRGANTSAVDAHEDGIDVRVFWADALLGSVVRMGPAEITLGVDPKADFIVPDEFLPGSKFAIVRSSKRGGVTFRFTKSMEGEFQPKGQPPVRLSTLVAQGQVAIQGDVYSLALPSGSLAWASVGSLRVEAEVSPVPKRAVAPFWDGIDFRFVNLALLMGFAVLAFVISAATYPFDTDTTADDLFLNKQTMLKFIVKPPEKIRNAFLDKLKKDAKGNEKADQPEKRASLAGNPEKKPSASKNNAKTAPKAVDINAKEVVKNSALFQALGGKSGGLSTILGSGGLGGDLKGALGHMMGPQIGDVGGLGGLGLRGNTQGGGGFSGTIGIGDIGTRGRAGGNLSYGAAAGTLGKKSVSEIAISSGNPQVEGSMDRELIRRVIHEHRSQVRYCYETELQRHPGLNGKVTVKFVIGSGGTVQKSGVDNSTLGNSEVENCIVARVYQWQFPKPKGGGIVQVSYPFLLKESGD